MIRSNTIIYIGFVFVVLFTFCQMGYGGEERYKRALRYRNFKFHLSKEQISALKNSVFNERDEMSAHRLYEYYSIYEHNEEEATKLLEFSAKNRFLWAQYELAVRCLGEIRSNFVEIDIQRGKSLLRKAANGGLFQAKQRLEEIEADPDWQKKLPCNENE